MLILAGSREKRLRAGWAGSLTVALPPVRAQLEARAAGTDEGARGVHAAMGTPGSALCTLINVCKHTETRSDGCWNEKIMLLYADTAAFPNISCEDCPGVCKGQHWWNQQHYPHINIFFWAPLTLNFSVWAFTVSNTIFAVSAKVTYLLFLQKEQWQKKTSCEELRRNFQNSEIGGLIPSKPL